MSMTWHGPMCLQALGTQLESNAVQVTRLVESEAKAHTPKVVRDWYTVATVRDTDQIESQVTNRHWMAFYLECGGKTKPHRIVSHMPPLALRFKPRGAASFIFRRAVNHPGSTFAPRGFMRAALDRNHGAISALLRGGE